MSPALAMLAGAGSVEFVDIIVSYQEHPQFFETDRVAQLGGSITHSYDALKMRAIRIPADALAGLGIDDNVSALTLDSPVAGSSVSAMQTASRPGNGSPHYAKRCRERRRCGTGFRHQQPPGP